MGKKRLMIYPCTAREMPLIMFLNELSDVYTLNCCCVVPGSGAGGKDIGILDNRFPVGYLAIESVSVALEDSDTLLITESICDAEQQSSLIELIETALAKGKEVLYAGANITSQFTSSNFMNEKHFIDLSDQKVLNYDHTNFEYDCFHKAPVVYVGGMLEESNTLEVVLALFQQLTQKGFKVMGLILPVYASLLGLYSYNAILHNPLASNDEKIRSLSDAFRFLEQNINPDLVLIQLPGAAMRFSESFYSGYGIEAQMLSQTYEADMGVFCINADYITMDFGDKLSEITKARFGIPIDYIHASNVVVDGIRSSNNKRAELFHVPMSFVDQQISMAKKTTPVFNMLYRRNVETVVDSIIEQFQ